MEPLPFEAHVLANIYAETERRFTAVDDFAHGWEHVNRVYKLAQYIAEQEGANQFVVGLAALMHDLGRTAPQDGTTHHADLSVTLASELLNTFQVPRDIQEATIHAIVAHSFSRNIEPLSLEARVVRDADRLDGLGATGIIRWAITGTLRRNSQTRTHHPTDPFAEEHTPDDHVYMLDHFYSKLLKLSDTMTTKTGRRLSQRRAAFMHAFLIELRDELEL
ncbi:MAG: HD domain-containing protein [Chloroflexi bacterium]|nr:MAG: HD domain-containing protein [Chloroflexota bacterium]